MKTKPPPGVQPWHLWVEENPDPSLGELLERHKEVSSEVDRRLKAGQEVVVGTWHLGEEEE